MTHTGVVTEHPPNRMSRNCAESHRSYRALVHPAIFFTAALILEKNNLRFAPGHHGLTVSSCQKMTLSQLTSFVRTTIAVQPLQCVQRFVTASWGQKGQGSPAGARYRPRSKASHLFKEMAQRHQLRHPLTDHP